MTLYSSEIRGGDYERGGSASSLLKERLKRIGADPAAIRKAMIAAYEAEMNVVIHAHGGLLNATVLPGELQVEIVDHGPGIEDIDQAMQEGYSTAPPEAVSMGFGAGMGLPNIKANSDHFEMASTVGKGTRVFFSIRLSSEPLGDGVPNALTVLSEACTGCLKCLAVCPTQALRVRDRHPFVLEHLCVDCSRCVRSCQDRALRNEQDDTNQIPMTGVSLLVPAPFLTSFEEAGWRGVLCRLKELGVLNVWTLDPWEEALRKAVSRIATEGTFARPLISPVCPSAMNLVALKFSGLLSHIAPFASPLEAAWRGLGGVQPLWLVPCCASHLTLLRSMGTRKGSHVLSPEELKGRMRQGWTRSEEPRDEQEYPEASTRLRPQEPVTGLLRVTGVDHVLSVLEAAENGLLEDVSVLELFMCDEGCFGSPLLRQNPFVSRHRWDLDPSSLAGQGCVMERKTECLAPRRGFRLDADMSAAIAKLAEMDRIRKGLPGLDCRLCGAPTCDALAEDLVLGRGTGLGCKVTGSVGKG